MDKGVDMLLNMLRKVGKECSYKKICEFTDDEKKEYNRLLNNLKRTNSSNATSKEKGDALEDLASYTLKTAHIFDIYRNIRTSTNELDQLVKIKDEGRILVGLQIIDVRLKDFICECKNYKGKIPVTYIGKVCSLLSTTQNKLCVVFSYNGVTGKGWEESCGLIKKFYLSKEKATERFCIIDFNLNDFEAISNGENFLQILENKMLDLKNDTDYFALLSKHGAEQEILNIKGRS